MSTIQIDLHELSRELTRFNESHIDMIRGAVARGIMKSIPELVRNSPVDTGLYANSWDYFQSKDSVTVGNSAPHAPIIEFGSRPHKPPLKPLLEWAKRVLQDPSQPPEYSDRVWALAIGTRNKIEKYGQEPKHIMMNNIPMILSNIESELKLARR